MTRRRRSRVKKPEVKQNTCLTSLKAINTSISWLKASSNPSISNLTILIFQLRGHLFPEILLSIVFLVIINRGLKTKST